MKAFELLTQKVNPKLESIESLKHLRPNRSLILNKYCWPDPDKESNYSLLSNITKVVPDSDSRASIRQWAERAADRQLTLKLESRLLINTAGSVLENASIELHRRSGDPLLPGSAVKGCARRAALQLLRNWSEAEMDNPDKPVRLDRFETRIDFACKFLSVFGFTQEELSDRSDLAWALPIENEFDKLKKAVTEYFDSKPKSRAGTVSFIYGLPSTDAKLGVDILNSHHQEYYSQENSSSKDPIQPYDNELPIPVFFLCVEPNCSFTFFLKKINRGTNSDLEHAEQWLKFGLTQLGIGAKTSAGYGWFSEFTACESTLEETVHRPSDYTETTFQNAVMNHAANPGQFPTLQKEIERLTKAQNHKWLQRFIADTSVDKTYKKLREKDWYQSLKEKSNER